MRRGGKPCPVAMVGVLCSNDGTPAVREALDTFIAE